MKRSGFKPNIKPYARAERVSPVHARLTVKVRYPVFSDVVSIPKEEPVHHEGYRRLTAMRPCAHCGLDGYSQAAHADMDKGIGFKTDDRTCFPACADRPGVVGCHTMIGASGSMTRDQRRALETKYAKENREFLIASGLWPADLQKWIES